MKIKILALLMTSSDLTACADQEVKPMNTNKVEKSESEWKEQLDDMQYRVTRKKGTERAYSGKYWDHKLEELDSRSRKIRQKMNDFKDQGLEGDALKQAYAEYRAKHITPQEEEILKKGISNQGYHYFGSGKIMSGIGKGFAEAMIQLEEKEQK